MKAKYDKIGIDYNTTRKADPLLVERLYFHLAPEKGKKYLDIGCGTGNYTVALNRKGVDFIGLDPSREMLKIAQTKNNNVSWHKGKAEKIPFEDKAFDGAIATLTLHHWSDLSHGFNELRRVLKPGGNLVVFTSTPKQMEGYWLNYYFPKMLQDSIQQMPKFEAVEKSLKESGFEIKTTEKYFVKPDLKDLFLYAGKHNPTLYLNEQIRKGISSFSSLAHTYEIVSGLDQLQADITSGEIRTIINDYKNNEGDYLFVKTKRADVLH